MSKEKTCLITQSLVGAVEWYLTAPDIVIKEVKGGDGKLTWKEKAIQDLYATVRRDKRPFPLAAKRGCEFEKVLYNAVAHDIKGGSNYFQQMCKDLKGYNFQVKEGVQKEIEGNICYLYGKYDAQKIVDGVKYLKDVKITQTYKKDKYLGGFQHELYCYISGADDFEYLIAEWEEFPKIKSLHREFYKVEDRRGLEREVFKKVTECLETIKDLGLWEDYRTKYCLY